MELKWLIETGKSSSLTEILYPVFKYLTIFLFWLWIGTGVSFAGIAYFNFWGTALSAALAIYSWPTYLGFFTAAAFLVYRLLRQSMCLGYPLRLNGLNCCGMFALILILLVGINEMAFKVAIRWGSVTLPEPPHIFTYDEAIVGSFALLSAVVEIAGVMNKSKSPIAVPAGLKLFERRYLFAACAYSGLIFIVCGLGHYFAAKAMGDIKLMPWHGLEH